MPDREDRDDDERNRGEFSGAPRSDFGGDYARDTHRGGYGDDYARDRGWSGGGRGDDYVRERPDEPRTNDSLTDPETSNKASE